MNKSAKITRCFDGNTLHLVVVFIPVLVVFLWSMPKTVVLEDDGTFILAAYYNGIAHPPGYPLYTFLSHWATLIPVGTIASRVHAFSALMGAFTCVVLWLIVYKLLSRRVLATTAGLIFGFSLTFWSQAIIAEVYALNVFLFLLLFLLCLHFRDKPDALLLFPVICFIYGLSLTNHWPLIILSTPLLLGVIWPVKIKAIKKLGTGIIYLIFGLIPYLWMIENSLSNPVISFYGPLESFSDFWHVVSREGYRQIDTTGSADWWDKLKFSGFVLTELCRQFRPFGILFILIGFLNQWRIWPESISFSLLLGFLGSTFLLIVLLGLDFDIVHMNIFRVYPVIAYAIAAIWLVVGVKIVNDWGIKKFSSSINPVYFSVLIPMLLILSVLLSNIPANYRAKDMMAHDYAMAILESLEDNAIFFTHADMDTGPIGYMNMIEGLRPDITVLNGQGLVFSNRIFSELENISIAEKKFRINNFIGQIDRPVYFSTTLLTDFGFEDYGLFFKINREIKPPFKKIILLQRVLDFFELKLNQGEPYDHWENMLYHLLQYDYCNVSASQLLFREDSVKEEEKLQQLKPLCRGFYGTISLAELMLDQKNPDLQFVNKLLRDAEKLKHQAVRIEDAIIVYHLSGKYYKLEGEREKAREVLQRSIKIWPNPDNRAYHLLTELDQP